MLYESFEVKENIQKAKAHCFRRSYLHICSISWRILWIIIFLCFDGFPEAWFNLKSCFLMPWRYRNIPKVILDRFGIIHFFMKIFILLSPTCLILWAAVLQRVSSVYNNSCTNLLYKCKESMGGTDVFFECQAPEKNKKYGSKVYHF